MISAKGYNSSYESYWNAKKDLDECPKCLYLMLRPSNSLTCATKITNNWISIFIQSNERATSIQDKLLAFGNKWGREPGYSIQIFFTHIYNCWGSSTQRRLKLINFWYWLNAWLSFLVLVNWNWSETIQTFEMSGLCMLEWGCRYKSNRPQLLFHLVNKRVVE